MWCAVWCAGWAHPACAVALFVLHIAPLPLVQACDPPHTDGSEAPCTCMCHLMWPRRELMGPSAPHHRGFCGSDVARACRRRPERPPKGPKICTFGRPARGLRKPMTPLGADLRRAMRPRAPQRVVCRVVCRWARPRMRGCTLHVAWPPLGASMRPPTHRRFGGAMYAHVPPHVA